MKIQKMSTKKEINSTLMMAFTITTLLGFINAQAVGSKDLFRCRQSCYQKVSDYRITMIKQKSKENGKQKMNSECNNKGAR